MESGGPAALESTVVVRRSFLLSAGVRADE